MEAFDPIAKEYDRWYEEPEGRAIFAAELECLRLLAGRIEGEWLEVGVGTGRFAEGLGIHTGVDPSKPMLEIAAKRGIQTTEGTAEELSFSPESFDGVLMTLSLCFVEEAVKALGQCARVLRPSGKLLIGTVPSDSPWGREYARQAAQGHPIYGLACFRTAQEIAELAMHSGFTFCDARSTLFWGPAETPDPVARTESGISPQAGFVGLLFEKRGAERTVG